MTEEVNTSVVDGYFNLISTLSYANKMALIDKLILSANEKKEKPYASMLKSFGAWESEQTADEIIADIRNSRSSNKEIEPFD